MPFVSVTRARIRRVWSLPPFARAAFASLEQARRADGFLGGSVLPDRRLTFWTMTVWRGEEAMRAYMLSGAHQVAMPKFARWCDEASVVHWVQAGESPPDWSDATERMRRDGRPSKLRRPGRHHQTMSFAAPRLTAAAPIAPAPVAPRPVLPPPVSPAR